MTSSSPKCDVQFVDVKEPVSSTPHSSAKMIHGRLIPPEQQILLYSSVDWELFIQEWIYFQKSQYHKVVRFAGANDMGVDVAAFVEESGLDGEWDNYQCKHYKEALTPKTGILEIGKIIWHIYKKRITCPRKYYFLAPKDVGMSLKKLLLSSDSLKEKLFDNWKKWCSNEITSKEEIKLEGEFQTFVKSFDFSIFSFKTAQEAIDDHRKTPYHVPRFGGGLPDRPEVVAPPKKPEEHESRYIEQLYEAYSDNTKKEVKNLVELKKLPSLLEHYNRQRENFYSAESLRNFARDTVPPGTFGELQEEVYEGVVDIEATSHACALSRLNAVTQAAAQLPLTANGLISVTKIQDKKGICHQLANDDKLNWKK